MNLDLNIRRMFLFKWIGSSSLNDNFDYESVIKKLKFYTNITANVVDFPYKDFVRITKSMNSREFEIVQSQSLELELTKSVWTTCLINVHRLKMYYSFLIIHNYLNIVKLIHL